MALTCFFCFRYTICRNDKENMIHNKTAILALFMFAASAASAQDTSSIAQLQNLDLPPVIITQPPAAPDVRPDSPIKNFGVAIWRTAGNGQPEGLVFRGAAPEGEAAFKFLGELGVKTIIDFRELRHDDKGLCAANGLDCMEYGIVPTPTEKLAKNKNFMQAFTRTTEDMKVGRKVFIHCRGGHHRTGALVAALTIRETACGKPFNRDQLGDSLKTTLKEYGFYTHEGGVHRFTAWEKEIRGWAENMEENPWLCK